MTGTGTMARLPHVPGHLPSRWQSRSITWGSERAAQSGTQSERRLRFRPRSSGACATLSRGFKQQNQSPRDCRVLRMVSDVSRDTFLGGLSRGCQNHHCVSKGLMRLDDVKMQTSTKQGHPQNKGGAPHCSRCTSTLSGELLRLECSLRTALEDFLNRFPAVGSTPAGGQDDRVSVSLNTPASSARRSSDE